MSLLARRRGRRRPAAAALAPLAGDARFRSRALTDTAETRLASLPSPWGGSGAARTEPTLAVVPAGAAAMRHALDVQHAAGGRARLARAMGADPLLPGARAAYRVALAQHEVGRELAALGPGWRVLHSVETAEGLLDHVVVGPAGLVVVTSVPSEAGRVRVERGRIAAVRSRVPAADRAAASAAVAARLVGEIVGAAVPVVAVVAIAGAGSVEVVGRCPVHVVPASGVRRRIKQLPIVLSPRAVDALALVAAERVTWGAAQPVVDDGASLAARFRRLKAEVEDARTTSGLWRLAGAGAAVAGALVGIPSLTHVLSLLA